MVFVNSVQIVDFQDVDSGSRRPELDMSLQAGQINVTEYPLRAAVFANVQSLSLHFVRLRSCSLFLLINLFSLKAGRRGRRKVADILHWI